MENRSRFNAVTHGLTAKTPVLPGESAEEFQGRIDRYKTGLETRTGLEEELAERAAMASWQLDRANRVEVARLARNIHTEPAMAEFREKQHAEAMGKRLFFDRRGPVELYPGKTMTTITSRGLRARRSPMIPMIRRCSLRNWRQPSPAADGCGNAGTSCEMIESGLGWQSQEKLKAVRLLGRQPLQAVSVREVAEVFLACHVVEPQFSTRFRSYGARSTRICSSATSTG